MSRFLDTRGRNVVAIALCQRCQRKMAHEDLQVEADTRLRVCAACIDEPDPYSLPARRPDRIALSFVLPEQPLTFSPPDDTPDV